LQEKELLENRKRYEERKTLYKNFGYDVDKERGFVLKKARPIYGDILEAGTGKGYFALALAKEGYRFTTFDISPEEQAFAKLTLADFKLDTQVTFCVEDGEHLSFKDKSFDVVFSVNTLHHLQNPYRFLDELARVLTLDGKIVLSDFTREGMEIMDKIHALEHKTHETGSVTMKEAGEYLKHKGLQIQSSRDTYQEIILAFRQMI